jgi:dTDP-4-amino-4,6-dideoxygalactose transaminase
VNRVEFFRHSLGAPELDSVRETLGSLFLTLGPRVAAFERRFAEYLGAPHVVATASCSSALLLALAALDIGPGDEVITTPMTFVASSNAILHAGATCVFADVDPVTGLLDPVAVARRITERTKAIIVVHLYGQLADMRAFRALADAHGLYLVEDAAHAIEAERDGLRTGQLGDAACFSFYATKTMTSGDGGAVAVHDGTLARRLQRLRNHGVSRDAASRHGSPYEHWDMVELGYKAAMTDIEASLLLPQLERLESQHARRAALVSAYEEALRSLPDIEVAPRAGASAHHLFTVRAPAPLRDSILVELGRRGIGCAVNYRAVHTLSYYRRRFGFSRDDFPHAAALGERTISLPLWHEMPLEAVATVVAALGESLESVRMPRPQAPAAQVEQRP